MYNVSNLTYFLSSEKTKSYKEYVTSKDILLQIMCDVLILYIVSMVFYSFALITISIETFFSIYIFSQKLQKIKYNVR